MRFQNVGGEQIQIWQSGFWPNTKILCHDEFGRSAEPTQEGRLLLDAFSPGGERSKNFLVTLFPTQEYEVVCPVALETLYRLSPSTTYEVRAVYEEHFQKGWSGAVTSNPVRVTPTGALIPSQKRETANNSEAEWLTLLDREYLTSNIHQARTLLRARRDEISRSNGKVSAAIDRDLVLALLDGRIAVISQALGETNEAALYFQSSARSFNERRRRLGLPPLNYSWAQIATLVEK